MQLTDFPNLLYYGSYLSPTLLRLAAAAAFLYVAYIAIKRRDEIAQINFPLIGKTEWISWVSAVFHAVIAFMLGAGYHTQIASIVGILGSFKGLLLAKRYRAAVPLPRSTLLLLIAILLSLLLSGAGALGFDLPL